ncbi:AAA family ATPase [Duganella sp. Root1480D1]|uniref:AAA family ATPase n=1 Tax=Duganella sp. Root1480D1 TaxID=1736471 RepID=UPI00070E5E37|nr:AAA family ATPase [Duganella sp. Root1480D1]KQZ39483.1 peptidoglycan-binding protein [Duganella sp. Root1480D1]
MYTQYFNLKQQPFSIAPDPRYLFMSERHREALAHLLYGVGSGGGFVLLTGEIGAGKTTVCRCFMEQIPADCRLAYIFNPKLTVEELLQSVCDEFGVAPEGASVKAYVDAVNSYLLESHAAGLNNVLVIDEAQNLSADVLEQLRLLTNLETSERKLLQIILIGQPELRQMLARPELEQLAQRVIARYHLGPLSETEVGSYIQHRLAVAGAGAVELFPRGLLRRIHQLSKGVPRRINLLCDRALLGAYVENRAQVNALILRRAAEEVFAGEAAPVKARAWRVAAAGVLAGAALTAAAAWQMMPSARAPSASVAAAAPQAGRAAPASAAAPHAAQAAASAPHGADSSPDSPAAPQAPAPSWLTMDAALSQLASKWDVALSEGEGCAEALKRNLHCMQTKGGLEEIRNLDRPVIIKLRDGQSLPRNVLLTALDGKNATLVGARGSETVALDALDDRFDGTFTTFWRAPRSWREEVREGDKGPDVDWLARRLAQMNGVKKPRDNQPLAGETLRYLREFQIAEGLKADGVAGPRTFIRLSQPGRETEPHLLAEAGK